MKVAKKTHKAYLAVDRKPFYHQLVKVERIYLQIKKIGLPKDEERETWDLVEETIYTRTIDAVLERLPLEKHEEFMEKFTKDPADARILDFLEKQVVDIKSYIQEVFNKLEKEILADIYET